MGAKSALKLRNRGIAHKCDICGRKLMTPDALEVHLRTTHNIIKRRGRPPKVRNVVKTTKTQPKPLEEVNIDAPPMPARVVMANMRNKVEFECPKCFKAFPTYFPALKHIQKYHCVNKQGIPVEPHDATLIQPERLEECTKCKLKVRSIHTHRCQPLTQNMGTELFVCAACDEWFPNLDTFNTHVVSSHSEYESLFFPTSLEFIRWKSDVEQQTGVNYAILQRNESRMYYHCSYVRDTRENTGTHHHICPSIIDIQEFTNGLQVHFYHRHYTHSPCPYQLPQQFSKYCISPYLARTDDYKSVCQLAPDDGDMYMQFKRLMEGIIVDAAKIDVETLRVILGKALEITSILSNYDEEMDDMPTVSMKTKQLLTDNDISRMLEQPLSSRKVVMPTTVANIRVKEEDSPKRNTDEPAVTLEVKRVKFNETDEVTTPAPKILNSYSLAGALKNCKQSKNDKQSMLEEIDTKTETNDDSTPSSFNDSYKHFVVKNFPNMESIASRTRSKPVIKTQLGQYKPNPISPKADDKKHMQVKPDDAKVKPKDDETKQMEIKFVKLITEEPKQNVAPKFTQKLIKVVEPTKIEDKTKTPVQPSTKNSVSLIKNTVSSPKNTVSLTKNTVSSTKNTVSLTKNTVSSPKNTVSLTKNTVSSPKNTVSSTKNTVTPTKIVEETKPDVKPEKPVKPTKNVDVSKKITRNSSKTEVQGNLDKSIKKVDFEYEVKEQADDCNILILKF
ncbi:uncharacterized protein LOC112056002 [Bicyclus anynana]|uniref:Uncharacterized protein LOC112056002 n=1 Tax=Bicyclus anynana TaxID=110368 RepID=A0A6J1NWU9_BICAN|nr:uncharacterized protein LOC112056002 [Bicyclus anynana]XP_052746360.1 uncharacterized protein LOC112056002 [Bicyclus anynana]